MDTKTTVEATEQKKVTLKIRKLEKLETTAMRSNG